MYLYKYIKIFIVYLKYKYNKMSSIFKIEPTYHPIYLFKMYISIDFVYLHSWVFITLINFRIFLLLRR